MKHLASRLPLGERREQCCLMLLGAGSVPGQGKSVEQDLAAWSAFGVVLEVVEILLCSKIFGTSNATLPMWSGVGVVPGLLCSNSGSYLVVVVQIAGGNSISLHEKGSKTFGLTACRVDAAGTGRADAGTAGRDGAADPRVRQ